MDPTPVRSKRNWAEWLRWGLIAALTALLAINLVIRSLTAPADRAAAIEVHAPLAAPVGVERATLITINLAHGRADGMSQLTTGEDRIRSNLDAIAALLAGHAPDLVCLQEADSPSWWSGDFDHVAHVARGAGLPLAVRAGHVDGFGLRYGTALLSRWPLADARARTFAPSPPTMAKGFTVAAVPWPGRDLVFDLVSVHTDFASGAVRATQVDELVATLRRRGRPVVIAGDLNSGWGTGGATRRLVEALDLQAWMPEAEMVTFPTTGARLDWVLVSAPFTLVAVEVLPDPVSDHRALKAVIRVTKPGEGRSPQEAASPVARPRPLPPPHPPQDARP